MRGGGGAGSDQMADNQAKQSNPQHGFAQKQFANINAGTASAMHWKYTLFFNCCAGMYVGLLDAHLQVWPLEPSTWSCTAM